MPGIGILTGLKREAACFASLEGAPDAPMVRCAAARADRAAALARELAESGVRGLVSFGLAGGLDPTLAAGTLMLPATVTDGKGGGWAVDAAWRAALARDQPSATLVELGLGVDAAAASSHAKAVLRAASGAAFCDMESHHVARAAAAAGLPFVVVRAIADTAETALPAWTLALADAAGGLAWGKVVSGVLSHPGDWRALVGLDRASRAALAALSGLVAAAGPFLGLPRL